MRKCKGQLLKVAMQLLVLELGKKTKMEEIITIESSQTLKMKTNLE
jgi:hypothetical protein